MQLRLVPICVHLLSPKHVMELVADWRRAQSYRFHRGAEPRQNTDEHLHFQRHTRSS